MKLLVVVQERTLAAVDHVCIKLGSQRLPQSIQSNPLSLLAKRRVDTSSTFR